MKLKHLYGHDTYRDADSARLRCDERTAESGVMFYVTVPINHRAGYRSVVCSKYFEPGEGREIEHIGWTR